LAQIQEELTFVGKQLAIFEPQDSFHSVIQPFAAEAKADLEITLKRLDEMRSEFAATLFLFNEDSMQMTNEEFFELWTKFVHLVERAGNEMERERVDAERTVKLAQARQRRLALLEGRKSSQSATSADDAIESSSFETDDTDVQPVDDGVSNALDKIRYGVFRAARGTTGPQ